MMLKVSVSVLVFSKLIPVSATLIFVNNVGLFCLQEMRINKKNEPKKRQTGCLNNFTENYFNLEKINTARKVRCKK